MGVNCTKHNPRKNKSGCTDLTAYQAMRNLDGNDDKFKELLHDIFELCDEYNFRIRGRIVLIDNVSGKVYK